ncbi:MAG: CaiB/BaiF CoA transferase family protein [Calditrichia bacterium]
MLKDLVVIELASVLAGPAVGMFFAELGATVIKVENPVSGGDVTRQWKLPQESAGGLSSYFCSVNWGKKSIGVDISSPEGKKIVHQLIRKADIVLTSYKKGSDEKLGMTYQDFTAINPNIIHGQIIGYSPEDERTAFDAILQAACGFTYMNGEKGGAPVKMPVALIDLLTAHQLKEGLLLALLKRERGEGGSHIYASLFESGIASLANQATNWLVAGHIPQRIGSEHPNIVPYGSIHMSNDDKEIVIAVGNNHQFTALTDLLGCDELAGDPQFSTNPQRVKHREELNVILRQRFRKYDGESLLQKMQQKGIPAEFVKNMSEVFEQPLAKNMILEGAEVETKVAGVRSIAFHSGESRVKKLSAPPQFGEHTEEVLGGLQRS